MKKVIVFFLFFVGIVAIIFTWIGSLHLNYCGLEENKDNKIDFFFDSLSKRNVDPFTDSSFISRNMGFPNGMLEKCLDDSCRLTYPLSISEHLDSTVIIAIRKAESKYKKIYDIQGGFCFPTDDAICDSVFFKMIEFNPNDSTVRLLKYLYRLRDPSDSLLDLKVFDLPLCGKYIPISGQKKGSFNPRNILEYCDAFPEEIIANDEDIRIRDSLQKKMFFSRNFDSGELDYGRLIESSRDTSFYSFYRDGRIMRKRTGNTTLSMFHNGKLKSEPLESQLHESEQSVKVKRYDNRMIKRLIIDQNYNFWKFESFEYSFLPNGVLIQKAYDSSNFFKHKHKDVVYYPNGKIKRETFYDDYQIKFFLTVLRGGKICPKPKYVRTYNRKGFLVSERTEFDEECYTGMSWKKEIDYKKTESVLEN